LARITLPGPAEEAYAAGFGPVLGRNACLEFLGGQWFEPGAVRTYPVHGGGTPGEVQPVRASRIYAS